MRSPGSVPNWQVRIMEGSRMRAHRTSMLSLAFTAPDRREPLEVELLESEQYDIVSPNPIFVENLHQETRSGVFIVRPNESGTIILNFKVDRDWTKTFAVSAQLENPYVYGEPIKDERLFFGRREELNEIYRGLTKRNKQNYLVTGPRRVGKTSLLHQLKARMEYPFLPLMLTPESMGYEHYQVFRYMVMSVRDEGARCLGEEPPPLSWDVQAASRDTSVDLFNFHVERDFARQLDWLARVSDDARVVLLLDEANFLLSVPSGATTGNDSRQQFLRHLLQHYDRVACVLAGTPQLIRVTSITSPLYNIFSGVKIKGLSPAETARLIREPAQTVDVEFEGDAVAKIIDYAGCSPYYTQALCSLAMEEMYGSSQDGIQPQASAAVSVRHVDAALRRIPDTIGYGQQSLWDALQLDEQRVLRDMVAHGSVEVNASNRDTVLRLVDMNLATVNEQTRFASIKAKLDEDWLRQQGG